MPFFDYKCPAGHVEEHFFLPKEEAPARTMCNECVFEGPDVNWALKQFPMVARTANRWGDTNGSYNKHLGQHVSNSMHREKVLREKGLVDLRDMPEHYFEDRLEKEKAEHIRHKKDMDEYKAHVANGESKGDAMAKTFSTTKLKGRGLLADDIRGE